MTLDKSAIDRIAELGANEMNVAHRTVVIGGETYALGNLTRIAPQHEAVQPEVKAIRFHTLTGLVAYLRAGLDPFDGFIHVATECNVEVVGKVFGFRKQRETFAFAEFTEEPHGFGEWDSVENALIWLRSRCWPTKDAAALVKCLGNITDGTIKTVVDDGFSQQVSVRAGATMVGANEVKSPVMLAPYRTFREVQQPQSEFTVRLSGGGSSPEVAFFESDGGAWRNEAIQKVVAYLKEQLPTWVIVG